MSITLFKNGHILHAKAMYDNVWHLALGTVPLDYLNIWNMYDVPPEINTRVSSRNIVRSNDPFDFVSADYIAIVKSFYCSCNGVTYEFGTDFILEDLKIKWVGNQPSAGETYTYYFLEETLDIDSLIQEVCRREVSGKFYVNPDPEGTIVTDDGRWTLSPGNEPTSHIYFYFSFKSDEAVNAKIYQLALFVGTKKKDLVPLNKQYLEPDEILDPGMIHSGNNISPFNKQPGMRYDVHIVVSF